jgi:low affinity Fe/Cu permease
LAGFRICERVDVWSPTGKPDAFTGAEEGMILTIVFVCLVLWLLGLMTASSLGSTLHILLVVAIVLFLVHLIQGRSIGNA